MKILSADSKLQFMPVKANKQPIFEKWEQTRKEYDFTNCQAYGLVCGAISGNVEAIDIDSKYDLTGSLFADFKAEINKIDNTILSKLVVQKTKGGGYHFIYRCSYIEGNKKLAQRHSSEEEIKKDLAALKIKYPDKSDEDLLKQVNKIKVLLETRGERGYIVVAPSAGYELIYGDFNSVQEITPDQRHIIFSVAYSFNEVIKEVIVPRNQQPKQRVNGLSPFEDYDKRGDVLSLLEKYGWSIVGRKGPKTLLKRPGDTKADHSGNFDENKNWFSVFSSSTEFQPQQAYLPYAVFSVLECNGNFSDASKKLYELGYGDRFEEVRANNTETRSRINPNDKDFSFVAGPADFDEYLHKWRTNTFERGRSTGMPHMDKYFLFKEGNLVIVNGIDNVGKSTVIWWKSLVSNLYHGWEWIVFSSENKVGSVMKKLIEFYWCDKITRISEDQYQIAYKHIVANYRIIKCEDSLYNYKDILAMAKKLLTIDNMGRIIPAGQSKIKGLLIDPYNSLKVDIASQSKHSVYDYHYQTASELKLFGSQNNLSIYLNCHAGTQAARAKDAYGYTKAPQKEDTEMGVMFANKADDFLTIHRLTQHPDEWMFSQIHVRKIKEMETGGKVTPRDSPVYLRSLPGLVGFECFDYDTPGSIGVNPVFEYHKTKQQQIQLDLSARPQIKAEALSFQLDKSFPSRVSTEDVDEPSPIVYDQEPVDFHSIPDEGPPPF